MGFEVPRREALMTFEGTDFDGAEIRCRLDVPLSLYLDIMRSETVNQQEEVNRRWAEKVLLSWNLEQDGEPVSADADGFLSLPPSFVNVIVAKWLESAAGVSGPLGSSSNGTGTTSHAGSTSK